MAVKRFEDLNCWKKARALVNRIYEVTRERTFSRDYGLKDQIRRAAVSVMSNIAEGFERGGNTEFIQFLFISKGSAGEVISQAYIALDQKYILDGEFSEIEALARDVSKMTSGLIEYLKTSKIKGRKFLKPEA